MRTTPMIDRFMTWLRVACIAGHLVAAIAAAAPARAGDAAMVVPPGREEFLATMLGRGEALPGGCSFAGGGIEPAVVRAVYHCPGGEVVVELRHPDVAADAPMRTDRFAITVRPAGAPAELVDGIAARVRASEAQFAWAAAAPGGPPSQSDLLRDRLRALLPRIALVAVSLLLLWRWRSRVSNVWGAAVACARATLHRATDAVLRCLGLAAAAWVRVRCDRRLQMVTALLLAAAVGRIWLAVVNDQSADDHSTVANMIWENDWRPPASSACMECSHAKLYHYALAAVLHPVRAYLPHLEPSGVNIHLLAGNLLTTAAGLALLLLFVVFSRDARWSPTVRALGIAFAAFNAGLVGIFAQTTNDGFCILFASLAIWCLCRFFAGGSLRWMAGATAMAILAALSKASGWVIFAAASAILVFSAAVVGAGLRRRYTAAAALFIVGFLVVVTSVNPYSENLRERGTPFVNDAFDMPLMREEVPRSRYTWAVENFLTFRYMELLRVPYNDWGYGPRAGHRESLWSQLYGRMFFLRFDQSIWQNATPGMLNLGRFLMLLALLPATALLIGSAAAARGAWLALRAGGLRRLAAVHDWHHLLYGGAATAALVALVANYHKQVILFTWMKAFYLFPAILAFYKLFLDGLEILWRRRPRLVFGWMACLVAASIVDTGWLISDLMAR